MGLEIVFGPSVTQTVRSVELRDRRAIFWDDIGRLQRPFSLVDRFPGVSRNAQPQALIFIAVGDRITVLCAFPVTLCSFTMREAHSLLPVPGVLEF